MPPQRFEHAHTVVPHEQVPAAVVHFQNEGWEVAGLLGVVVQQPEQVRLNGAGRVVQLGQSSAVPGVLIVFKRPFVAVEAPPVPPVIAAEG